jgi:hypothetical protein
VAWFFFLTTKSYLKEVHKLRLKNKLQTPAPAGKKTGRRRAPDKDVISYLIIQSFEPGTINVLS